MDIAFTNHARESIKSRIGIISPYAMANAIVNIVQDAWAMPEHKVQQNDSKYLLTKNGFKWVVECKEPNKLIVVTVFPSPST